MCFRGLICYGNFWTLFNFSESFKFLFKFFFQRFCLKPYIFYRNFYLNLGISRLEIGKKCHFFARGSWPFTGHYFRRKKIADLCLSVWPMRYTRDWTRPVTLSWYIMLTLQPWASRRKARWWWFLLILVLGQGLTRPGSEPWPLAMQVEIFLLWYAGRCVTVRTLIQCILYTKYSLETLRELTCLLSYIHVHGNIWRSFPSVLDVLTCMLHLGFQ